MFYLSILLNSEKNLLIQQTIGSTTFRRATTSNHIHGKACFKPDKLGSDILKKNKIKEKHNLR